MDDDLRAQIRSNLDSKETEELLEIWQNEDLDEWDEIVFEIVEDILLKRLGYVPQQSLQTQVMKILSKVDRYLQTGDLEKALSECELALQMTPTLALAYNYRGLVFEDMEQLENALTNYQAAIQLDPELEDAWDNMTVLEEDFEQEFQLSPTKEHLDLALEYAYDEEPEKAMQECELARLAMPNIAMAYNYLGMISEELNHLEPAIDSYYKAIQLNPRFYAARENLANARVRLEEEQYRQVALEAGNQSQEVYDLGSDFEESKISEIFENATPVPGWVYLDEKAFLLIGWPGHRVRPRRSGYDKLDMDFELAHIQGVIIRALITRKFRTRNPLYFLLMVYVGLIFSLPILGFLLEFLQGNWVLIFALIGYLPYLFIGVAILINVFLSLGLKKMEELDDNGDAFI